MKAYLLPLTLGVALSAAPAMLALERAGAADAGVAAAIAPKPEPAGAAPHPLAAFSISLLLGSMAIASYSANRS